MTVTAQTLDPGTAMPQENRPAPARPRSATRSRDGWIYLVLGLLTALAWWVSTLRLFTPDSDMGYWLGVTGGSLMLLVFAYPMRKHLRFMQRWGAGRHWFIVHMLVGVGGPFVILLHSGFTIGSINAGVALFSMVIVASSGVIGRFLYVRVHRDLHGEKHSLDELRAAVRGSDTAVARLRFAPQVQEALRVFEAQTIGSASTRLSRALAGAFGLSWRRWQAQRRCRSELRAALRVLARAQGWSPHEVRSRLARSRRLVNDYLTTVQRIAQFKLWERLFSLWHVAHVPFVYMMVLSAVAHVVAVHVY